MKEFYKKIYFKAHKLERHRYVICTDMHAHTNMPVCKVRSKLQEKSKDKIIKKTTHRFHRQSGLWKKGP